MGLLVNRDRAAAAIAVGLFLLLQRFLLLKYVYISHEFLTNLTKDFESFRSWDRANFPNSSSPKAGPLSGKGVIKRGEVIEIFCEREKRVSIVGLNIDSVPDLNPPSFGTDRILFPIYSHTRLYHTTQPLESETLSLSRSIHVASFHVAESPKKSDLVAADQLATHPQQPRPLFAGLLQSLIGLACASSAVSLHLLLLFLGSAIGLAQGFTKSLISGYCPDSVLAGKLCGMPAGPRLAKFSLCSSSIPQQCPESSMFLVPLWTRTCRDLFSTISPLFRLSFI